MNYIGSKKKLIPFLQKTIHKVVKEDMSTLIFCDLFAGTGIVGSSFKTKVGQVISNDYEYYSYVLNRNYIGNYQPLHCKSLYTKLNELDPVEGFIYKNYCNNTISDRNYFTPENGKKIDAIRITIEQWRKENKITENQYFHLLASLLESADKVANIASVYGAYLKHIKKSAAKPLQFIPAAFETTASGHQVYQGDSNAIIKKIKGDVLYLDPPYNARQYGANYHMLNTIAKYDTFVPRGKTGLRDYYKSNYCKKNVVVNAFDELIKNAQFQYIFLSYNNEGLMTQAEVKAVMEKYGAYSVATTAYQRFKADKTENRNHKAISTVEYLHVLIKNT